jgi:PadR family transcriptional regulator, regulatory protein PadR
MSAIPQGTLNLLILRTLAHGRRHGYAIARWIEETTDDVLAVEEGALYPALYRLQRSGWIRAEWARSELNKDIKVYELTLEGRAELRRRTTDWHSLVGAMAKVLTARS